MNGAELTMIQYMWNEKDMLYVDQRVVQSGGSVQNALNSRYIKIPIATTQFYIRFKK